MNHLLDLLLGQHGWPESSWVREVADTNAKSGVDNNQPTAFPKGKAYCQRIVTPLF
jgi:hypothetical protein